MHFRDPILEQRQVPVVVREARVDTRDPCRQPLAVCERNEQVLRALPEQDRHTDVLDREAPCLVERQVVVAPARDSGPAASCMEAAKYSPRPSPSTAASAGVSSCSSSATTPCG